MRKTRRVEKLKPGTTDFLAKQREMKRETTRNDIDYTELCRSNRRRTRQDLRELKTKEVKIAIESGKYLKK